MNRDLAEHAILNIATADGAVAEAGAAAALRRAESAGQAGARHASRPLRVAIVHDWLVTYAGAERVLEQIVACFPDADLFSLVDFLDDRAFVRGKRVTTSFIQKLPFARTRYRSYLPLMPLAIEQLDVSGYDLVISSSHAVAKGVLTGPDQMHISYVHSPIRYAWDLQHQYLEQSNLTHGPKSLLARMILHYIRNWDTRTANAVDGFVANSAFIARRIRKVYHRDAAVIFPPVDVDSFSLNETKDDFYLTASRMVPYKKIDLIVDAFSRTPERKLVVIGDGPEMQKIRAKAGPNVEIMGYQPFAVLHDRMRRAKAFVFAAEEDFGISVVEAQACGTPVIAYGKGGALETVLEPQSHGNPTGLFFDEQTPHAIVAAVDDFERAPQRFTPKACRANAERFSADTFRRRFIDYVEAALPGSTAQRGTAAAPMPAARGPATLVLDQSGVLGGAELSLLEIMKHMRANADVLLFDDGPFRVALDEVGARVDVLDQGALAGVRKQGGVSAGAMKQLVGMVRDVARRARRAEVIYANTQRAMVVAALAGRLARKPVVWHLRDIVSDDHFGSKQLMAIKYCARLGVTRVIANSDASAQAFRALTGFTPQHVDVVFNGISAEPFDALDDVSQAALRALRATRARMAGRLVQPPRALEGAASAARGRRAASGHARGAGRRAAVRRGRIRRATARDRRASRHGQTRAFPRFPARRGRVHEGGGRGRAYVDHARAVRASDRRGHARAPAGGRGPRGRGRRDHRGQGKRVAVRAGRRGCAGRCARQAAARRRVARAARRERACDGGAPVRHRDLC